MSPRSPLRRIARWAVAVLTAVVMIGAAPVMAATLQAGDLAPLGSPDGQVNAADYLVLQQMVLGKLTPTASQRVAGDVAPLGHPDGKLDAGDLVVLMRAIQGKITLPAAIVPPTLNAPTSPASANPLPVSGTTTAGVTVRLYVNGVLQGSVTAATDGRFTVEAVLNDGTNTLYVTAWDGSSESAPSTSYSVDYQNTISRDQSSTTITQDTVWTPGSTPAPYIISGTLTVNPGVKFTILAGTELRFNSNATLVVNGSLDVQGVSGNEVTFTSNPTGVLFGTSTAGYWSGIQIAATAQPVRIAYSKIQDAQYGIDITSASDVVVSHCDINESDLNYGNAIGVYGGSTAKLEYNVLIHTGPNNGVGINISGASPVVVGNTITGFEYGIEQYKAGSPQIVDGNSISENYEGIALLGDGSVSSNNPTPVITGNKIFDNQSLNIDASLWVDPSDNSRVNVDVQLDVSGNWWGTTDPSGVSGGLSAYDGNRPVLKVVPFLDEAGNPVSTPYLNGLLDSTSALSRDTSYTVVGSYVVSRKATLTISPGVHLTFGKYGGLAANGTLNVLGESSDPVQMDSSQAVQSAGDWVGVTLWSDNSTISHAIIGHAGTGVRVLGGSGGAVNASVFNECSTAVSVAYGIKFDIIGNQITGSSRQGFGVSAASGDATISGNTIQDTATAISITTSSPTLTGNVINNNGTGIYIYRSYQDFGVNPVINGDNRIINNDYGIYVKGIRAVGEPAPQIHDNEIHDNADFNVYMINMQSSAIVDASENWWGTEVEDDIVAGFNDPYHVLYSPYKNAVGDLVQSTRLSGVLGNSLTLAGGQTYAMDALIVPKGVTLTIGAGAQLEFPDNAQLIIDGNLVLEGTQSSPITFTRTAASSGYWGGLYLNSPNVTIHDVVIEHASTGIHAISGTVDVSDSRFTDCQQACLWFEGQEISTSSVSMVHVSVHRVVADGVMNFKHATGDVSGNVVSGLYFSGVIYPFTVSKNLIQNTGSTGISLTDDWTPEMPVVNYNNLESSGGMNYVAYSSFQDYITLDATNNWWGTDVDADIQASIQDRNDDGKIQTPVVTYSPYLSAPVPMPPTLNELPSMYSAATLTVAGHGDPGEQVRVYLNSVDSGTGTVDAGGNYSIPIALTEGDSEIHVVGYADTIESYPSRSYHVTRDVTPPVITLTSPVSGSLTNQSAVTFTGSVNEPSTLVIGGNAATVNSDNTFSYGPYFLTEGANSIDIVATDLAGNVTTQTVQLTLDSTPPAAPNMGAVTISDPVAGVVTVAGAAGSVDASTQITVINARTGESAALAANADGSFSIQIKAQAGDAIYVASSDAVGNQSTWGSGSVAGTASALAVGITSPADGASIAGNVVNVQGTYQGPGNSSVMVNNMPAIVYDGKFYCNNVPLNPGSQTLQVNAATVDGTTSSASVTVTSSATSNFIVNLDRQIAIVGEPVELSVEALGSLGIQNVDVDFNGDSVVDASAAGAGAVLSYTYTQPGLYTVTTTITDSNSNQHVITQTILVRTAPGELGIVRQVFDNMRTQLAAGNITQAEGYLTATAKAKYDGFFVANQANLSTIASGLGDVVASSISGDVASLYVLRDESDGKHIFNIYLVRGRDGIWRIADE